MGKSSAILDASVEALKDATTSNRQQLKSLKDATAKNLDRIASNANVIEALKAGSFKFECKSGWTGDLCELDVNECLKKTCRNGMCRNLPGSFKCECKSGWKGDSCELDINECLDKPCGNGGICQNLPGSFKCDCSNTGYVGELCSKGIIGPIEHFVLIQPLLSRAETTGKIVL